MATESVDAAAKTAQAKQPPKPAIWNDERYRAIFFQVLVLAGTAAILIFLVQNTLANMAARGISSGFGFLGTTAGFGIGETLIQYSEESSYGRAFVVGLLNTVLVASIGVVLATILGFFIGILRLSNNWLVAKLAAVYIELLRNIPLLLQIFFWYFAVLRQLPSPRESATMLDTFFLNNRGLITPAPIFESGFSLIVGALFVAIAVVIFLRRWAHKR
ncbi:MAG: ABC transporter permease subunit, partial [Gammaproteobacteria bacterium]